ncbi:MAG: hypothetical protein GF384_06075 [Elusimicrobia bacterium]|nr:hypothetical protein [Elusimicrobiota bacterium]
MFFPLFSLVKQWVHDCFGYLGSQITYIDKAEDLPMSVAAGVSYTIMAKEHGILLGLDAPYMVNKVKFQVFQFIMPD